MAGTPTCRSSGRERPYDCSSVDGTLTFLGDPDDDVAAVRDRGSIRAIACDKPLEDRFCLSVEALTRWMVKN
jgi:hypothetical protein